MTAPAPALELRGVRKRFGAVVAVDGVDFEVARGAVHGLVGENGAGKSTLMKIAYGHTRADAGEIRLGGEAIDRRRHSPRLALDRRVGMVHQHFMLVDRLTVIENVVLGREPRRRGLLDLRRAAAELRALGERYGLAVDPHAPVEDLSVGQQQRVEILKALWRGCDVLILDEPTAVLGPGEVEELFSVLRALVASGGAAVLVTHKLDEVLAVAERVSVMRRGSLVAELAGAELRADRLARAMVGRALAPVVRRAANPAGEVLAVSKLTVAGRGARPAVEDVDLSVRAGEIVGVAGVEGNGQAELVEAIVGLRPTAAGRVLLAGADVTAASVAARLHAGLAHVPEDRNRRGLVADFTVADNAVLGLHRAFAGPFGLRRAEVGAHARALVEDLRVHPPDPEAPARTLSGGNQQKVVVGRELGRTAARLLVCAQPTRGVDIAAIELIHARLLAARDRGLGVLLVSAELSELQALSDRLVVMYRGRLVAELSADALAAADALERIGQLMTGAAPS
jgi:general nucleoside transport system ATP-binding protein